MATTRLESLSAPKRDHLRHDDLRSVYWRENSSISGSTSGSTSGLAKSANSLTERQQLLSGELRLWTEWQTH